MKDLKILELKIKNIAGIEAFELSPEGEHVVIGGKNAAGKSSVLNAITAALGGKKNRPEKPVRNGADEGETVVDLGDLVVKWKAKSSGNEYLSVENKDGATYKRPQELLARLWGERTFDPLAFFLAKPADQAAQLARLVGTELEDHDAAIRGAEERRRDAGRDAKRARAAASSAQRFEDIGTELVSTADLSEELGRRKQHNRKLTEKKERIEGLRRKVELLGANATHEAEIAQASVGAAKQSKKDRLAAADEKIARLKKELKEATKDRGNIIDHFDNLIESKRNEVESIRQRMNSEQSKIDEEIDHLSKELEGAELFNEEEVIEKIKGADELNAKVRANLEADRLEKEARESETNHSDANHEVMAARAAKTECIAAAPIPVAGLGLEDGSVTFNDRPLSQCSAAERLKISIALGLAENPAIRVMLIDRWQDLDDESREIVRSMAADANVQIWTTVVGTKDEDITVEIREGKISRTNQGDLFK